MSESEEFGPLFPRPQNWDDVFAITKELKGVPIEQIEQGRVDWEYDFSPTDMRSCGREGCEQDHAHGWVVAIKGERYVNIGKDCARKYAHTQTWEGKLISYRTRVNADARTAAILNAADEAQRKQFWLDNSPEVDDAIALHQSFLEAARGPFLREIERRAEKGITAIERDVKLTDEERDTRRIMQSGNRFDAEPELYVSAVEKRRVADLVGLQCFRPQQSPGELRARLQRLVDTLLTWSPKEGDVVSARNLVNATRDLGPISNQLNTSVVATRHFFSEANLQALMRLEVVLGQGIIAIERDGPTRVKVIRRPDWGRQAA